MEEILALLTPATMIMCLIVAFGAGIIKGMVGFAMPMIMISGLSSIVGAEWALAGLILPTVATNLWQALRQGWKEAWHSVRRFRLFLMVGFVTLVGSAQLVRVLPADVLLILIGSPIVVFALIQLIGVQIHLRNGASSPVEVGVGAFAGLIGGVSGIWGPPTVMYLTAINTPKRDQIRIQGVIYGLGAIALLGAHIGSGVVRFETIPFSAVLLVPALIGTWLGFRIHDKIDQVAFKKATLIVLLVVGANLVRKGVMG